MLSDIFGQAIEAMKHNRRRTMITVVGMAWGIATVVLLLAYGAGVGFDDRFEPQRCGVGWGHERVPRFGCDSNSQRRPASADAGRRI